MAGSANSANKTKPATEARSREEKQDNWSADVFGCGAQIRDPTNCRTNSCGRCLSWFRGDHVIENDFDLLIENASPSYGISDKGIPSCPAGGDGCSVGTQLLCREQKSESVNAYLDPVLPDFSPLLVA
jgi:hypothetical protein